MSSFANILIFQPAAIGDIMLATPVIKTFKHNYPHAKIIFWGHKSLEAILTRLCPYIDQYIDYHRKDNIFTLLKIFRSTNCDLFVDLSNSTKGKFISFLTPGNIRKLAYKKESSRSIAKMHAVQN